MRLSDQLRRRRLSLGLTLEEVARRAGTSAATLSRYERGWSRFEVYTLRKLATALGCDLEIRLEPRPPARAPASDAEVVRRLGRLFWDQDLTRDHLGENILWVVERVLELGTLEDLHCLIGFLGREPFLQQVRRARFASERTRSFWRLVLEKEGMTCTPRFSRREAASSWRGSRA